MKSEPRDVLRDLLRDRGPEIETNPQLVRALLSDLCPGCRKEINLIVQAQQIEIPRRLKTQTAHLPVAVVLPMLNRLMEDHYGTSPEPAQWAVETWVAAMGFEVPVIPVYSPPAKYQPSAPAPQKPTPRPVKPATLPTAATPSAIRSISPVAPPPPPVQPLPYSSVQPLGNPRRILSWVWVVGIIAGLGLLASWGLGLLVTIVVGLIAGALASYLMKAKTGLIVDLILGVVGSVVGGWITSLLMGIDLVSGVNLTSIIVALIGAIVVIFVYRLIKKGP